MFTQKFLVAFENRQGMVYAPVSGWDRAYLLWTFRNFRSLPQNVLNPRQQQLMASLYHNTSEHSLRGLSDAFVVGSIEDFDPDKLIAISNSRKDRMPASSPPQEKPADVVVLDRDQHFHAPFTLGRMTLKIGAGALVALIAILGWRQLGAQPFSHSAATNSPSTPASMAAPMTEESSALARNSDPAPVAAPALVAVAIPLPPTTAPVSSATDGAIKPTATTPPVPVKSQPYEVAANTAPANFRVGKSYRSIADPPAVYDASDDRPRTQISGRPRKLIYPICPETRSRGKVSLQAVVEYDGKVSRVRVLTGDRVLAKAAVEAVRQWRYEPASGPAMNDERETNITVSFVSDEVIAVSFPDAASMPR